MKNPLNGDVAQQLLNLSLASGPRFRFSEQLEWQEFRPLALLLVQSLRPQRILEVGTTVGDSYLSFCQAVRMLDLPTQCVCIPRFEPAGLEGGRGSKLEEFRMRHNALYSEFSEIETPGASRRRIPEALYKFNLIHIICPGSARELDMLCSSWLPSLNASGVALISGHSHLERSQFQESVDKARSRYCSRILQLNHWVAILSARPIGIARSLLLSEQKDLVSIMDILRLAGQRAEAEGPAMDAQIRLGESKLRLDHMWVEKEKFRNQLLTAEHRSDLTAEESPARSSSEVGLFADARRILQGLRRHYSGETQSLAPPGRAFWDDCGLSVLASILAKQDRMAFPKASRPKVSVVVVLRNKAHLSILCLCSLLLATAVDYELIIVDNDSSDETADVLRLVDSATVIRNRENLGFGPAVAEAASRASGEFLCLLNNDTLLQPRSLASLLGVFAERPDAGAVGGMIRLADGRLQEAGCIVWRDGTVRQWGRECDPHLPKYCFRRPVDYCSAACLVTPRLLFQAVGGLDDRYAPAYYEDVDYCMKLWNVERPVFYEPRSVVHHYEGASSPSSPGTREMILVNHRRFVDRWRAKLNAHQMDGPKTLTRARFAAQSGSPSWLYFLGKLPERLSDCFLDPRLQQIRSRVRDRNLVICMYLGEDRDPQLRSAFPIDVELRGLSSMKIDEVDEYCQASDLIVVAAGQQVSSGISSILEKYSTKISRD